MFSPQTIASTLREIPHRFKKRGKVYYFRNLVRLSRVEDNQMTFSVKGSRGAYTVDLWLEEEDDEIYCACDCPYGENNSYCKHIAAALYFLQKNQPLVKLYQGQYGAVGMHPAIQTLGWDHLLPAGQSREQYQLRFGLTVREQFHSKPEWYWEAYSQYIKKDGSPGRILRYIPSHNLLPLNDKETAMLQTLMMRYDRNISFAAGWPFLREPPYLPLILSHRQRLLPLAVQEIQNIEILFQPKTFHPELTFTLSYKMKGVPTLLNQDDLLADAYFTDLLLLDHAHQRLYALRKIPLALGRFLSTSLSSSRSFTEHDCRRLPKDLEPFTNHIHIQPLPKQIQVQSQPPRAEGWVTQQSGIYQMSIVFHYGEKSFPSDSSEDFWESEQKGRYYRRDRDEEEEIIQTLMAFGWSWLDQSQSLDMPPEDFSTFLQRYFTSPLADKLRLNLEKKPLRQGKINIEVASGIDWLGLQLIVDDTRFTTDEIMEAKHGLIQTKKQFLAVDQEYLEHLRALQARSISSSVTEIRISNHDALAYPELKKLVNPNEQGALIPLQKLHQAWQDQDLLGQQPASILLQAQLRPYQKEGLNWLRLLKKLQLGGILADDMGLGKTLQSLALMADYLDEGQTGPFLILAPVSTLRNWQREIQRFLPALPCLLHIGPQRPEHLPHQAAILTSYQTYLQDQHIFQPMPFTLLIIDEAQNLKNPATKAFKAVQSLQSGQRLLLTGTPMENSLIDLWALMQTALPHYLGEKKHFKRTHITAKNQDKEKALAILHQKLKPFLLRRTKESVAQDLPSKEEIPLWVEMDQAQKRSYLNLEAQLRHKVQNLLLGPKPWLAGLEILQALTQLRQLAIAPELIGKKLPSAKFQLAVEKIDEALSEDHSVLVFSQFTGALKILRRMLDDRRLSYAYLDGSMSSRQREKEIQAFSESAGPSLFLLSLKAGGVGLNLTKADYVFLLDPWWNPAVENQAIDRSHRIGQSKPVLAYRFLTRDTVEEKILELQQNKRDLVEQILGGKSSLFQSLDPKEIMDLFQSSGL